MKKIFLCFIFITNLSYAQLAGTSGAFARMGFGARGMGMGNALSAVTSGELTGLYNPAAVLFQQERCATLSYGFLSLDRSLNALLYNQPLDSNAGISFGVINSGTSNIDGRDIDGYHTEMYTTSENLFSLSFSLKIRKIAIGLTSKLYYYKLFEKLSSTGFGFDLGVLLPVTQNITVGAVLKDLNVKYKWDTSQLYGELGNSTTEKFPQRRILSVAYNFDNDAGIVSAEIEFNNISTPVIRLGGELRASDIFILRAGIDSWDLENYHQAHPSFGFTLQSGYSDFNPALHYAYVVEPYGVFSQHIISVSVKL